MSLLSIKPLDPQRPMLASRRFWSLIGAQALGAFADNALRAATIVAIAAAWRLAAADGGAGRDFAVPDWLASEAGTWVGICFTGPILLFSLIAGQVADRIDRHTLLRIVKLAEVVLVTLAALSFALGNAYALMFFLFLMGSQSAFLSPTRTAMMPHYFAGKDLVRANGYFNAATLVAVVFGLGLGGLFIGMPGGRSIVSALLVAAAGLGAVCAFLSPAAPSPGLSHIEWNVPRAAVRIFRTVASVPGVVWPMIGFGWFWGLGALTLANLPNFVRAIGGVEQDFALLQALFALGAGLGSVAGGVIAGRMREPIMLSGLAVGGTVLCALGVFGASLPLAARAGGEPQSLLASADTASLILAALLLLTATFNGAFAVPLVSAVQARAPMEKRAQIMGAMNMTNGGLATLMGLFVPLSRPLGLTPITLWLAVGALQIGVLLFMVHRWREARRMAAAFAAAP